ncbi:MAG: sugar nucleotide-binding protein [Clostridia bacterium]
MKPTWLITGASGFLSSRIIDTLANQITFIAPTHAQLEITNAKSCSLFLNEYQPAVVVHAAAISQIDECERDPARSMLVNVRGAENLARACTACGAKLLFCSTDQVYSGCGGDEPLNEAAELAPTNTYARHKLLAEAAVAELCPNSASLRLTWMFDLPARGKHTNPNLITGLLHAAVTGAPRSYAANDHRAMTYVREVAENLPLIAKAPAGVYNYGAENELSSYETARGALRLLGAQARMNELVTPASGAAPRNLWMDTTKAQRVGCRFSRTLAGVERMLKEYGW